MKNILLAIIIAATSLLILPYSTRAQTYQSGIQVAPAISEAALNPGESQQIQFTITNTSPRPEAIQFEPQSLDVQDLQISDSNLERYDASSWLTLEPNNLLLGGGEQRSVVATIAAPRDASPGGHYATIKIRALVDETANIKSVPEINAVMFVTVAGDIVEQLVFDEQTTTPFVQFRGDNSITASLRNNGNVHALPRVEAIVSRNDTEIARLSSEPLIILPNSSRQYVFDLANENVPLGVSDVEYRVAYGNNQSELFAPATTIITLPSKTALVASVAVLFVLLWVLLARRRIVVAWHILTSPDSGHSRLTAIRALADRDIVANLSDSEVESILDELDARMGRRRKKTKK